MRIISLVPSWTETLIKSGIYPVGRTRFCIHPQAEVEKIPVVGGTKTVNWDLIAQLKPDLIILDREENPLEFSQMGLSFWASHVVDGVSLQRDLLALSKLTSNSKLAKLASLAEIINLAPVPKRIHIDQAIVETLWPWDGSEEVAYIIWKNPWMSISKKTYIGFVLEKLGAKVHEWDLADKKYPEVTIKKDQNLLYLFSSEPFPFVKIKNELIGMNIKSALVDGEKFSWFGIRSLQFIQKALELPNPE